MSSSGDGPGAGAGAGAGAGSAPAGGDGASPVGRVAQLAEAVKSRVRGAAARTGVAEVEKPDDKRALCESYVASARQKSPMVKYLLGAMRKKGCLVPQDFIQCIKCGDDTKVAGAFAFNEKGNEKVYICQEPCTNNLTRRTIVHELIHAFDYCRAEVDENNCYHAACTEIRAANLSTDCAFGNELRRVGVGNMGFAGHQQACVKRRAVVSIKDRPACAGKDPLKVVNEVFERCYRDTAPFPDAP